MVEEAKPVVKCSRRSERHQVQHADDVIEFHLHEILWRLSLLDISTEGVSFGLNDGRPELEVGTILTPVVLRVSESEIRGGIAVTHVTEEFSAGQICGATFLPASESDRRTLETVIGRLARGKGQG